MARRSDHSRSELEALLLAQGHSLMEETGFARFSAREVAKRAGYTIGTIYNVYGSLDGLLLTINARTVADWREDLEAALAASQGDRIEALVRGYFGFARDHRNLWAAIYDHRLPDGVAVPDWYVAAVGQLTGVMRREIRAVLLDAEEDAIAALSRSLLACVHGHCVFAMNGTFAQLGEAAPLDAALMRVREALAATVTND